MAIKGGSIIHVGNGVAVIDRVQTGGPGQLNIPTEKIYELGNYKSVATIRDTPDLTFTLESFDVSTEVEELLTRAYAGRTVSAAASGTAADPTLTVTGGAFTSADVGRMVIVEGAGLGGEDLVAFIDSVTDATHVELSSNILTTVAAADVTIAPASIDLATAVPVDFASQFKAGRDAADPFDVTASVALPFLYLESMSYRFGLRDNATQTATLRGDTIFYNPGGCFIEESAGTNTPGQTVVTDEPAYQLGEGDERRVLSVTAGRTRLTLGADYTESYGAVVAGAAVTTITLTEAVPTTDIIRIVYSSPTALSYPQNVHPDTVLKPAAVRGRDIEVYVGGYDPEDVAGSQTNRLTGVQAVTIEWRVTIEKDEEFGNHYAVAQDFDVPTVSGTVDIKPRDPEDFLVLLRKFTGVSDATKVIGPSTAVPLELSVVVKHPDTGNVVKRFTVDDARFTVPGYSGRVQQKLTVSISWESDEGDLLVSRR